MAANPPAGDCFCGQRRGMRSWGSVAAMMAPRFEIFSSLSSLATWSRDLCVLQSCSPDGFGWSSISNCCVVPPGSLPRDLIDCPCECGVDAKMAGKTGREGEERKEREGK